MEKILITGANGLLGQHLIKLLLQEGYLVVAAGRGPSRLPFAKGENFVYYTADITDEPEWHAIINHEKPDVIVHTAAVTQVDECELHQEKCEKVNVQGTAQLLVQAESAGSHFIYLSTDFVFDGEQGFYREDDPQNPVNWYGFTKVQAESMVEISDIPWTIVRTCLVYGNTMAGTRSNIISWIKENLANGRQIKLVTDQWRTPTFVEDLAKGILLIIRQKATGVFHLSGKDRLSPYEIGLRTAAYFSLDASLIEQVNTSTFRQPAKRPPKTGFDISKAVKELGYDPLGFEEGLKKMFS
jgi:dTDP-4-dehydrorhamnose reductase